MLPHKTKKLVSNLFENKVMSNEHFESRLKVKGPLLRKTHPYIFLNTLLVEEEVTKVLLSNHLRLS